MKTSGLALQEALQALVDGKAKAAQYADYSHVLRYDQPSGAFFMENDICSHVFKVDKDLLLPQWSLIDPVQEYEEVEVVMWAVFTRGGAKIGTWTDKQAAIRMKETYSHDGTKIIKMTGIDRVPKKEKVTRRVEVGAEVASDGDAYGITDSCLFKDRPEAHGKTGKLIFEWEE